MKKLKPVRVWAIALEDADKLAQEEIFKICWAREDVEDRIKAYGPEGLRVVPCLLVPIEPKRKARVRK